MTSLRLLLLIGITANLTFGQPLNYGWHKNIPSSPQYQAPDYSFSETRGDTLYIVGKTISDSLDADPTSAFDWIYDEGTTTESNIIVLSKYLISDGSYLGSFKLIEFENPASNGVYIRDFVIDNEGNFILVGNTSLGVDFDPSLTTAGWYGTQSSGGFIVFYYANGSYNAHIEYEDFNSPVAQFSPMSANVDDNNNLYVAGRLYGSVDLDFTAATDVHTSAGSGDGAAIKINLTTQSYEWGISFGGVSDDDLQYATLSNNTLVLYGFFESNIIDLDPGSGTDNHTKPAAYDCSFINQIDANGNQLGGFVTNASYGYGITSDELGNIYVLGQAEDGEVTDLDPSTNSHFLNTDNNNTYYVAKYDNNLSFSWARAFSGPYGPDLISIAANSTHVAVSGDCYHALYLSNLTQVDTLSNPIDAEFFITSLNSTTGNLMQHVSYPFSWSNNQSAYGNCQNITANGDLITVGAFKKELDFNPLDAMVILDTTAAYLGSYYYNPFIIKMNWDGFVSITEANVNPTINLFPNPGQTSINITSELQMQEVLIIDLKGRIVMRKTLNGEPSSTVNIESLENGIYIVQITPTNGEKYYQKLIKN